MTSIAESVALLDRHFAGKIREVTEFRGETTARVPKEIIAEVAAFLKEELHFNYLVDISSVDHFGEEPRFEVVYEFSSMPQPRHLRVKVSVSEDDLSVPTLTSVYQTANWHEREIYDMMGIHFAGHPDLRRILMWEGYPYFPLRKDFPLEGRESNVPGQAFTEPAPLEGGPFVAAPAALSMDREPRARRPEEY
jgi:NADH-quinone oxidoreductase subunit C